RGDGDGAEHAVVSRERGGRPLDVGDGRAARGGGAARGLGAGGGRLAGGGSDGGQDHVDAVAGGAPPELADVLEERTEVVVLARFPRPPGGDGVRDDRVRVGGALDLVVRDVGLLRHRVEAFLALHVADAVDGAEVRGGA